MHSVNRNSYLQSRTCGINPRIINRCVDRARGFNQFDAHDVDPPLNRLASEQPGIPIDNIDLTRRPLAFGRRAIPKLILELHDPDPIVVLQAVTSFTDILHDPEKGYEAIRLRVPDRMIDLLKHSLPEVRERACMCLTIIAGLADGKEAILRKKQMIDNLRDALEDERIEVRMKLALCLEMISRFWKAADILVEAGFVETLLDNLDDNSDIIVIHMKTLCSLMYCDGKEKAFVYEAFHTFVRLLDSSIEEVQSNAAACLAVLTSVKPSKELALENKLLPKLCSLLQSETFLGLILCTSHGCGTLRKAKKFETALSVLPGVHEIKPIMPVKYLWSESTALNSETQINVISAIMFCTVLTKAKCKAFKIEGLLERLIELAKNPLNVTRQIYCFKALTNICEHPAIRNKVRDNYLDTLEAIEVLHGDCFVLRCKQILLGVIKWIPMTG